MLDNTNHDLQYACPTVAIDFSFQRVYGLAGSSVTSQRGTWYGLKAKKINGRHLQSVVLCRSTDPSISTPSRLVLHSDLYGRITTKSPSSGST